MCHIGQYVFHKLNLQDLKSGSPCSGFRQDEQHTEIELGFVVELGIMVSVFEKMMTRDLHDSR